MIREITINNIALIDNLTISFDEGFNVLTGETGAGKSIIIDSVNLALGERADRELIQTRKDSARVEVLFHLQNPEQVNHILAGYGIEPEDDGSLLLMRELTRQGKTSAGLTGDQLLYPCCVKSANTWWMFMDSISINPYFQRNPI